MWVVCMRVSVYLCVTRPACARGDRCVTTWPHPRATRHLLSLTPVPFVGAKTSFLPVLHTHAHTPAVACLWGRQVAGLWRSERNQVRRSGVQFDLGAEAAVPLKLELHRRIDLKLPFCPTTCYMLSCLPTWWYYCNLFLKMLQPLWTIEKGKGMITLLSSYKL